MQVFLSLTDPSPEPRPSASNPDTWKRRRAAESTIYQRLLEPAREGLGLAVHWSQKLLGEAIEIAQEPEKARKYVIEASELIKELAHSLTLPNDPKTLFKGRLGVRKRLAWAEPLSLDEVKAVSKVFGCSVGKVFFGVITDRKLVPQPKEIIKRFKPELENLVYLSLMLPVAGPSAAKLAEDLISKN